MTAQELKNSILQLAIQGKLVKQDPNDEPASVLLERIKEEREKLIKEKKIKREKYSEIYKDPSDNHYYEKFEDGTVNDITEEIPFEIPNNWEWIRINSCADIYTGNSISETIKNTKYTGLKDGFNYIATKDVNFDNTINYDNGVKIPFDESKFKKAYKNNTLICVEGGSAGRKVALLSEDVCFGNKLATINSWIVNTSYIYIVFQSSIIQNFFKSNMTGIIGGVSINKLKAFLIPIPPIKEQTRIVEKYRIFLPLFNIYDKEYNELEHLNANYKDSLKKSILQYAIQGKLVKQEPNDEPADKLIERILDEKRQLMKDKKIKKENLSIIYKDTDNQFYEKFDDGTIVNVTEEIPFEAPNNWTWVKLKEIAFVTKLAGFEYTKNICPNLVKTGIPLFKGKNVQNGKLVLNFESFIPEKVSEELPRSQLRKKCLLTPYVGTIGNIAIFDGTFKAHLGSNVGKIELYGNIMEEYVLYFLRSNTGNEQLKKFKKSTAQESISIDALREAYIAVPPLEEQKKIVNKIEKLFQKI